MSPVRRHLPSMSGLAALEAFDRLGSVSSAADELSLTQGAVSRALKSLEDQLGVPLFVRDRKRLSLTTAAQDYVQQVRRSLEAIAQASSTITNNPQGGSLRLAILPAFGVHWLAPKLARFATLHPNITVNLTTRLQVFDFAESGFDAAIHFGRNDWPGAEHLFLLEETVLPVCAPALLSGQVGRPEDLLNLPLLQLQSRPGAWRRYLAGQGVEQPPQPGMSFDQFATMKQAAIHGLGVALLPEFMVDDALVGGQLVVAWDRPAQGLGSYFLVWPKDFPDRGPLIAFRRWLRQEVLSPAAAEL